MSLLTPSGEYTPIKARRDRVFVLEALYSKPSLSQVTKFFQFVTGSNLVLVSSTEVAFTAISGVEKRPIAHTCVSRIDISTEYESLSAFSKEFDFIITKEECFQYSAILNNMQFILFNKGVNFCVLEKYWPNFSSLPNQFDVVVKIVLNMDRLSYKFLHMDET